MTGKYRGGARPQGSRATVGSSDLGGRMTDRAAGAVEAYAAIAEKHGLDLTQMSLAWCLTRPFHVIPIFGATTMEQLDTSLSAADLTLDAAVLEDIAEAHKAWPMPY